jgi:HD-like signal output (HDOD) protein
MQTKIRTDATDHSLTSNGSESKDVKMIVAGLGKLPTLPDVAVRALAVVSAPESHLKDFASLIETDPVLASGILNLANSALFRAGREISSLKQAAARLGFRQCRNLLVATSMRSLFEGLSPESLGHCEILWQQALLASNLCRHLNMELQLGFQGEEIAGGLCHDLGRILLAIAVPQSYALLVSAGPLEGPELLKREHEVLGTDHCSLGSWYASRYHFPLPIVNTIAFHHVPEKASAHGDLVSLVAVAEHIVQYLQSGNGVVNYDLRANQAWPQLLQHFPRLTSMAAADSLVQSAMGEAVGDKTMQVAFAA